ncbi:tripartite tricarboxylate transporter substrate binding protein [Pigmentiphaga sp. H8]|uniref:Bug family tripartite tricarboxylate transporter substrate binding protein n=1 Tax=Pigmentiphaga sp. H8 TaxID=2488560 RepID=UPI000F596181|nr:tripartite tricarboxylate transporter substrate binding protein [Pigmentiphaga sp. H8]AZG07853.1 tripartite tricarboxylate transporter substrate binding protein [Pigmentiphaga sp. H8]
MDQSKRRLLLAAAATVPAMAAAQLPTARPVKIITPFPVGTGPDNVMRLLGEKLSRAWDVPVIIDNRTGGNGWIAIEAAKRAAPDGYTLLQLDTSFFTVQPYVYKKLPFDPFKDFEPVSPLFTNNYFIVVATDSKWRDVRDLAAAAKAAQGKLPFGSSGIGSQLHINAEMLASALHTPMTHIPIRETPQIYVSIARGDLAWAYGTGSTAGPLHKSKKVRFLALAAPSRHPSYPDVPTVAEAGGPNIEARGWTALFAPAGSPKPLINRMNADIRRMLMEPDVQERLEAVTFLPWAAEPAELQRVAAADSKQIGEVVKSLKISLD